MFKNVQVDGNLLFQRMTVLVLTTGSEDRPVHDASTLLSMIGQLCQLLDGSSSAVDDIESWLIRLCKEQTVGQLLLMCCHIVATCSRNVLCSLFVAILSAFAYLVCVSHPC